MYMCIQILYMMCVCTGHICMTESTLPWKRSYASARCPTDRISRCALRVFLFFLFVSQRGCHGSQGVHSSLYIHILSVNKLDSLGTDLHRFTRIFNHFDFLHSTDNIIFYPYILPADLYNPLFISVSDISRTSYCSRIQEFKCCSLLPIRI